MNTGNQKLDKLHKIFHCPFLPLRPPYARSHQNADLIGAQWICPKQENPEFFSLACGEGCLEQGKGTHAVTQEV